REPSTRTLHTARGRGGRTRRRPRPSSGGAFYAKGSSWHWLSAFGIAIVSSDSPGNGTSEMTSKMSHLSFHFDLSLAATTYIGWRSWWSHARKVSGRPLSPSIAAVSV